MANDTNTTEQDELLRPSALGAALEPDELDNEVYDPSNIPDRLPDGIYNFEVVDATLVEKTPGNVAIVAKCTVIDGEFADQYVSEWIATKGKGLAYTPDKLLGIFGRPIKGTPSTGELRRAMIGRTFRAKVTVNERESDGKRFPNIERYLGRAVDTGSGSTLDSAAAKLAGKPPKRGQIDL